jgi:hypothetical protein
MVEGHVPKGVEVQVLSSAYETEKIPVFAGDFVFLLETLTVFSGFRSVEFQEIWLSNLFNCQRNLLMSLIE